MVNTNEHLDGAADCKAGNPPRDNPTPDYLDGYGLQYQAEQLMTEMGLRDGCN
jgi:hypothetical protein